MTSEVSRQDGHTRGLALFQRCDPKKTLARQGLWLFRYTPSLVSAWEVPIESTNGSTGRLRHDRRNAVALATELTIATSSVRRGSCRARFQKRSYRDAGRE